MPASSTGSTPRAGLLLVLPALLCIGCIDQNELADVNVQRSEATRLTLEQGEVIGGAGKFGNHAWLGLRYARAPVGELRWRAPQAPMARQGTFEALQHGAPCPQLAGQGGGRGEVELGEPYGNEDCLFLNIFAPPGAPRGEARLPVMFWIHGGGNSTGDASPYDGGLLAVENRVILVAVQYRLGPFGWFRHPWLRAGADADEASGNFALLDLVRALAWVQQNIHHFGGDPKRVTVFGESAGGSNTFALLLSPLAAGLFQRAIVQSGNTVLDPPEYGETPGADDRPEKTSSTEVVLRLLGEAAPQGGPGEDQGAATAARGAAALRALPMEEILIAYRGDSAPGAFAMINLPRLFADGVVLPGAGGPAALRAGRFNEMPVMLGTNRDETKLFQLSDRNQVAWLFGMMPLYAKNRLAYDRDAEYGSKWWKLSGVDEPARMLHHRVPTFAYRFDWDEEPSFLWWDFAQLLGAAHALEIPFVFGKFELGRAETFLFSDETRESRELLSRRMRSYWSAFAASGDPGTGQNMELPRWTAWDESRPTADRFMLLDSEAGGGLRMSAGALTRSLILEQIAADPRFLSEEARCEALEGLWRVRISSEERRAAGCTLPALPE